MGQPDVLDVPIPRTLNPDPVLQTSRRVLEELFGPVC